MKKKIAIYTTFNIHDPSYSLNVVAETHLQMLLDDGYEPIMVVMDGFKPSAGTFTDPRVKLVYMKHTHASNEGNLPEGWEKQRDGLIEAMDAIVKEEKIEVIMTHDLIASPAELIPNLAMRTVAERNPKVVWLQMIHSVWASNMPSNVMEASQIGRSAWPTKSYLLFPNSYDIPRIARNYNVSEDTVKHVPHATSIYEFFNWHPKLIELEKATRFLDREAILVAPMRLDRGKQLEFVIETGAALKRSGITAAVVVCDFSSTGGDKITYRDEMKELGALRGLSGDELIFLSERIPEFKYNAPHSVVMNLFAVSNVFICSSKSETYSLVTQEAALCGNAIILNADFPAFKTIFGASPKHYRFSSNIDILNEFNPGGHTDTKYPLGVEKFADEIALFCREQLTNNRVLEMKTRSRMTRNTRAVFKRYLEPLFGLAG